MAEFAFVFCILLLYFPSHLSFFHICFCIFFVFIWLLLWSFALICLLIVLQIVFLHLFLLALVFCIVVGIRHLGFNIWHLAFDIAFVHNLLCYLDKIDNESMHLCEWVNTLIGWVRSDLDRVNACVFACCFFLEFVWTCLFGWFIAYRYDFVWYLCICMHVTFTRSYIRTHTLSFELRLIHNSQTHSHPHSHLYFYSHWLTHKLTQTFASRLQHSLTCTHIHILTSHSHSHSYAHSHSHTGKSHSRTHTRTHTCAHNLSHSHSRICRLAFSLVILPHTLTLTLTIPFAHPHSQPHTCIRTHIHTDTFDRSHNTCELPFSLTGFTFTLAFTPTHLLTHGLSYLITCVIALIPALTALTLTSLSHTHICI